MSENSEKNTKITPVERTDGRKVTLSQNASKASADGAEHAPQGGFTVRKKFGGTETQIRSALTFYKWCAWISGTFLLLLVVEMITHHGMGYDLVAGAKDAATGSDVSLGILNRETGNLTGGVNISTWCSLFTAGSTLFICSPAFVFGCSCAGASPSSSSWRSAAWCRSSHSSLRSASTQKPWRSLRQTRRQPTILAPASAKAQRQYP